MDSRARELVRIGRGMFSAKQTVDQLHQEIALNFYPERANFTEDRTAGEEFSDHLFSSYPVLARRELGNLLSSNLRPQSQKWFSTHVDDEATDEGKEEREYLEFVRDIQWRAMYDPKALFVRATKEADHDYAAFGNCVIYVTPNMNIDGLLFRNFHLRDCTWFENADGIVDGMFRRWCPTAKQLVEMFPKTASKDANKAAQKDPTKKFDCYHIIVPARMYKKSRKNGMSDFPFVSLYVEMGAETTLEEVGLTQFPYVVPRWQTVSGSQYGLSMATSIALPDGRTTQVVVRTLREAGEKYVDPPMIAVGDAIRNDIASYAGGITIVDMEYDERLGDVLRPISQNSGNMPIGFEIAGALKEDIRHAFFLDKIQLPAAGSADMTAFEVRRRLEEHIRAASPLFEPVEKDYNMPLCELAFNILQENGAFPVDEMPPSLSGRDIRFTFRSPLAEMADQNDAEIYKQVMAEIFMPAAQVDPSIMAKVNLLEATSDAARAAGFKAKWMNDDKAVEETRVQAQQQQEAMQQMEQAERTGQVAEQGGKAAKVIEEAMNG